MDLKQQSQKIVQLPIEPYSEDLDPQLNCPHCDYLASWSRKYLQFECERCDLIFDEELYYD